MTTRASTAIVPTRINANAAVTDFFSLVGQVVTAIVTEGRARAQIDADTRRDLARIRATQGIVLAYLDAGFAERREVFAGYFSALDTALAAGQTEEVVALLGGIVKLAERGPASDLRDMSVVADRLAAKDSTWHM